MIRPGASLKFMVTIALALILATAGITTVMAQALGPAGPSPATGHASVVAQAVVELPEGDTVWRIRNIPVEDTATPIEASYPAFVTVDGVPILIENGVTGLRKRVASGEAAVIAPSSGTTIRSMGPRQDVTVVDVLPVSEATISGATGSIGSAFPMTAGAYDVDVIRDVLAEGESTTIPRGNGPTQLLVQAGQAEVETADETFNMAAGSDRIAAGDITITANTDDTIIIAFHIGPDVLALDGMNPSTPAPAMPESTTLASPTPAPPTPAPAEPTAQPTETQAPTPAPTETVAPTAVATLDDTDSDGDGLSDLLEAVAETDPAVEDTDDDGINDGQEVELDTDPLNLDTDGDTLYDGGELIYEADPLNPDTDGDGLSDGDEIYIHRTDPTTVDTDGDGVSDFDEVEGGTNPLNRNSD